LSTFRIQTALVQEYNSTIQQKTFRSEPTPDSRIFGLDLLRACAILLVVFVHTSFLLPESFPNLSWLPDGVDLFFVLSGFLVGGILIRKIRSEEGLTWKSLTVFLKRRWFRTLPNYFLFLFIYLLLVYFGFLQGTLNKYVLAYFVFLQNMFVPVDFVFWESWSLSVEEWFYLSFPLLFYISLRLFRSKLRDTLLALILLYILVPLLYRIQISAKPVDLERWDLWFRKLVATRLDSIGFGLLGAFIYSYSAETWKKFRNLTMVLGFAGLSAISMMTILPDTFFFKTFYFSLTAFFIALLLPKLNSMVRETIPGKPFRFLSRISYSMYLCNLPILLLVKHFFHPEGGFEKTTLFFVCWVLIILASLLIYKLFEYPITKLRDRL